MGELDEDGKVPFKVSDEGVVVLEGRGEAEGEEGI